MRSLFLPGSDLSTRETVEVEGADFHHLSHVLRARVGESLILLDDAGNAFHAEIVVLHRHSLTARLLGAAQPAPEPSLHITVAQALGKGDRFEQVLQHATEVGASAFIPLSTARSVVRLTEREAQAKHIRWFRIVKGAAEQAGRARIPAVLPLQTLAELTADLSRFSCALLLHPKGERMADVWAQRLSGGQALVRSLLLMVGPEGGFSGEEIAAARQAGAHIVSLGAHTLRTETAALVAVSQALYHFALLDGSFTIRRKED
jgi:16S rRNA (uracil1498-N3)-methyltransferase